MLPFLLKVTLGTSLVVQQPRLQAPTAGGLGLIPGQGTILISALLDNEEIPF